MQLQSRTVHAVDERRASESQRHLPLVDLLIDTRAELTELVVRSGLKVLGAMLEDDRSRSVVLGGMDRSDRSRLKNRDLTPTFSGAGARHAAGSDLDFRRLAEPTGNPETIEI